ncbi:hypothetical protein IJS77_01175 [bacterium]|nr:hypothetical protein [bacterium]
MSELLTVFLLILISVSTFGLIILILKADKKVLELNDEVTKVKTIDFTQLKKIVAIFNNINKNFKLDKIKYYIEVAMTVISTVNLIFLIKNIISTAKRNETQSHN